MKISVTTKELVERTYNVEVQVPLGAGDAVYRQLVRHALVSGELLREAQRAEETMDAHFLGEKIIRVDSDLGQLYPRVRKQVGKVDKNQTTIEEQLEDEHL